MAEKKKTNLLKIPAVLLILVLALLGGRAVYTKKTTVDYYKLKPVDINHTVLASGRVSFPQPYEIIAAASGKISVVNCREGEAVEEGRFLIQMEDFQDRQNVELALSDLNLMQSKKRNIEEVALPRQEEQLCQDMVKLLEAEIERNRQQVLYEQGAIPAVDFERAGNNYQLLLSQYNQAVLTRDSLAGGSSVAEIEAQISHYEAELKIAQKAVEDKRMVSPVAGTVSKVHYSHGQQVLAGEALITLLKRENWVVEADVDQKELSYIKPGQPALVALDAYPQEKFEAQLDFISPQIDQQKGTCLLRLEIKNGKSFIRHGMAANVELLSETNSQVLALPKQFVDFTEREAFVWVLKDNKAVKTPVTYRSVGERWVIVENLQETTIILDPAKKPGGSRVHLGQEVLPDAV